MENNLPSTSLEGFMSKLAAKANDKYSSRNIDAYGLLSTPSQSFKPRNIQIKTFFFVFSFNLAEPLKKTCRTSCEVEEHLVTDPGAIFFVFEVKNSYKTPSIIPYFKYASYRVVTKKKRQNTNPHRDGILFSCFFLSSFFFIFFFFFFFFFFF